MKSLFSFQIPAVTYYLFCGNVFAPICGYAVFSDDLIATFSLGREISEFDFIVHLLSE